MEDASTRVQVMLRLTVFAKRTLAAVAHAHAHAIGIDKSKKLMKTCHCASREHDGRAAVQLLVGSSAKALPSSDLLKSVMSWTHVVLGWEVARRCAAGLRWAG